MNASGFLLRLVASTVKVYRHMPMKISSPLLSKMYYTFLYSGSNRGIVTRMIEGINYELDLKEVIDSAMYYGGTREPGTSQALKTLCKHGDVVLDIGANVGSHSLPIASHVGEHGRVYAFEPVPWAIKKLKRNLALNKFDNIIIEPIALSDIDENEVEMKFRASFKLGSKSGVGQDGKIDNGWWSECELVKVRMETLDSYVKNHQINRLDLIK